MSRIGTTRDPADDGKIRACPMGRCERAGITALFSYGYRQVVCSAE